MKDVAEYAVKRVNGKINGLCVVPGSKSMTNRALLLAALSEEECELEGVLFSDDSRHFLGCLESLGFSMTVDEEKKKVRLKGEGGEIPQNHAVIDVGSAGTAARFLTAMLALSGGSYEIRCSEQMKKRPMAALFELLEGVGATFEYLGEKGHLPVKVQGVKPEQELNLSLDISRSTQYLSAMLMMAAGRKYDTNIRITSEKKDGSYIRITRNMLKEFGVNVEFDGENYRIAGGQNLHVGSYYIEPDVSAACYFYGIAAITGGCVTVKNVFASTTQGDWKFIEVLGKLGCTITETTEGACVAGPDGGEYDGIDIDMNDFSDQALTMAVVMAFAKTKSRIRNIGHIRGQECNRMAAIVKELGKCGVSCMEEGDDIVICPDVTKMHGADIETYDDHRVAMAFSLLGLKLDGVKILNPMCCTKTFENYFECLDALLLKNGY